MNVIVDVKLLAALRERIHRLASEPFSVYGYEENGTIYVLAGWFEKDGFDAPVSDLVKRIGSIVHSSQIDRFEQVFASTDDAMCQSVHHPFQFTTEVQSFSTVDVRSHIRGKFLTVYMKGVRGCSSPVFVDIHSDHMHTFPITGLDATCPEQDEMYLAQAISTDSTYSIEGDEAVCVGLISRSGKFHLGLNALWDALNTRENRGIIRHFGYLHIPVHTTENPASGCPVVCDTPKHPNMDVHYLIKKGPFDGIIVQNGYRYFHYNVDGYNDSGWGCAYRSIQTLLSWFITNFNVCDSIPRIEELQAMLKKGDYAFGNLSIGSKQWIGCIEAGIILREVSNGRISHKILTAFTIEELEDLFMRQVHQHAIDVGSPVMVGAGDYAFTVIGLSQVEKSVLVIDPHFLGSEYELALSRGYIGWKDVRTFFEFTKTRSQFINICIPSIQYM